jgi:cyanophycinase
LVPDGPAVTVIGVDEDTALVGGPTEWTVQGRQSAWRLTRDGREQFPAGTTVLTPIGPEG